MRKKYLWIVFIYKCLKQTPKILLFKKEENYIPIVLENVKPGEFNKASRLFTKLTGINKEFCYPHRFFESAKVLSTQKDNELIKIWVTSVRLRENYFPPLLSGFASKQWFSKEEAYEQLKHWRGYSRAFRLEFLKGDTSWECLGIEKESKG